MALQFISNGFWILILVTIFILPKGMISEEANAEIKNTCSPDDALCNNIFELKLQTLGLMLQIEKQFPDLVIGEPDVKLEKKTTADGGGDANSTAKVPNENKDDITVSAANPENAGEVTITEKPYIVVDNIDLSTTINYVTDKEEVTDAPDLTTADESDVTTVDEYTTEEEVTAQPVDFYGDEEKKESWDFTTSENVATTLGAYATTDETDTPSPEKDEETGTLIPLSTIIVDALMTTEIELDHISLPSEAGITTPSPLSTFEADERITAEPTEEKSSAGKSGVKVSPTPSAEAGTPSASVSETHSTMKEEEEYISSGDGDILSATTREITHSVRPITRLPEKSSPVPGNVSTPGMIVVEGQWTALYTHLVTEIISEWTTEPESASISGISSTVNVRDATTRRELEALRTTEETHEESTSAVLSTTQRVETSEADTTARVDVTTHTPLTEVDTTTQQQTTHPIITTVKITTTVAPTTEPESTEAPTTPKPLPPQDCDEIWKRGSRENGVYRIYPSGSHNGFKVFCDLRGSDGGWTVIQRRVNGSVNFYRPYFDYVIGFGSVEREFYLGNENIHRLTYQKNYELAIIMFDFEDESRYARYRIFRVDDYASGYQMSIRGYIGNAGNSLGHHSRARFSTFDRDNDDNPAENCALTYGSGWWFTDCDVKSNLNGKYLRGEHSQRGLGILWKKWKGLEYSLKYTEMRIKPSGL